MFRYIIRKKCGRGHERNGGRAECRWIGQFPEYGEGLAVILRLDGMRDVTLDRNGLGRPPSLSMPGRCRHQLAGGDPGQCPFLFGDVVAFSRLLTEKFEPFFDA